jgi:eukaryotic-like serine/threonine-protein kinase
MFDARADRDLILALLALRSKLITQEALIASLDTWAFDRERSLVEILVKQGALACSDQASLEATLDCAVAGAGGDLQATLSELGAIAVDSEVTHTIDDFQLTPGPGQPTDVDSSTPTRSYIAPDGPFAASGSDTRQQFGAPRAGHRLLRDRFRVLALHARGGLGQVFRARDEEFGREVALKEIRPDHAHNQNLHDRFSLEAEINGSLEHPGIVPVYSRGRHPDGRPYYVMRFIRGATLKAEIQSFHADAASASAEQRKLRLRRLLARFVDICDAIAYAHSRGVLHRDLKPANIMLGEFGETLIVDWGLAKMTGGPEVDGALGETVLVPPSADSHEPTVAGSALGTPEFMSPEQAAGAFDLFGPTIDVYGLGAILYTVLTGSPPITAADPMDALKRARDGDIPPLGRVHQGVPRALEAVCMKALARAPLDRYQSARALADDIEHWLADEPVSAWREPWAERITRWERRNRLTIRVGGAALGLIAVVASAAAITVTMAHGRERRERLRAEAQEQLSIEQSKEAQRLSARMTLNQGLTLAEGGEVGRGLLLMTQALRLLPPDSPELDRVIRANLGGWRRELITLERTFAHPGDISAIAFSPDGSRIATAGTDKTARLWDVSSGRAVGPAMEHHFPVNTVAWSADGRWIATGSGAVNRMANATGQVSMLGGEARIFSAATSLAAGPPLAHKYPVQSVTFSSDSQTLTTGSGNVASPGEVRRWDVASRREQGPPLEFPIGVLALAYRPDGKAAVIGTGNIYGRRGEAQVWSLDERRPLGPPLRHQDVVSAVCYSPDGDAILTGSWDQTARLWDAATGSPLDVRVAHSGRLTSVSFLADGGAFVTSADDFAQIWDRSTGRPRFAPLMQLRSVSALCLSPDNTMIVTGGDRDHARAWRLPSRFGHGIVLRHDDTVESITFSPDNGQALTASKDGTAQVWNVNDGAPAGPRLRHPQPVQNAVFSPDGKTVLTGSWDETAQLWDRSTGQRLGMPMKVDGVAWSVAFSPDGRTIFTGIADAHHMKGGARFWDAATQQPLGAPLPHANIVQHVAFRADGQVALTSSWDASVKLWEVPSGRLIGQPFAQSSPISGSDLSPDGTKLVMCGWEGPARIWDISKHEPIGAPLIHRDTINDVRFSPDGCWVATASDDETARLWDASTGRQLGAPMRQRGMIYVARFSPDGLLIATGGSDRHVRLWDRVTSMPLGPPLWLGDVVTGIAFSPDGRMFAAKTKGKTARLFRRLEPMAGDPGSLQLWAQVISGLELEADGHVSVIDPAQWNANRAVLAGAAPTLP